MDAGRFEEAAAVLRRGLDRDPANAVGLDALGTALGRANRTTDAIVAFRAAVAAAPGFANAACNLGKTLVENGDVDEALTWFERAIALEPDNGCFYLPLVIAAPPDAVRPHVAAMLRLDAAAASLPPHERIDLHFALAAVFERDGRIDDAFRQLQAANALKRARLAYDEAAALAFVRSTTRAFGHPMMDELRGCGDDSARPIFIVGMPRSGSTLVEQLLAAHPDVAAAGEIGVLAPIVRDVWPKIAATSIDGVRAEVRAIGERYLRATDAAAGPAARLTDKTLDNLQVAPLIHVALPNARIVHVRRDDLDTCLSCFATSFGDGQVPFAYDLGELGRLYRGYLDMMARWRAFIAPERLLEIDYERLVADFATEARRIVAFCGLPWDDACLDFHTVRRPVRTASNVQVRKPLYARSVGRAQPFRAHLAPLIAALETG
jgi:tetratricopeptide (TPR) repeat protein